MSIDRMAAHADADIAVGQPSRDLAYSRIAIIATIHYGPPLSRRRG
jgi:hypothetical protein